MNAQFAINLNSRKLAALLVGGCLCFAAVTAAPNVGQAMTITDLNTNTVGYSDNYTNWTAGQPASTVPAQDTSTTPYPIAQIGTNVLTFPGGQPTNAYNLQVTTSTTSPDPGPPAGNGPDYLRDYRTAGLGGFFTATLASPVTTIGDVVEMKTLAYVPNDGANGRFELNFNATGGFNPMLIQTDGATGFVASYNGTAYVDTTMPYTPGVWQQWTVDYALGASTFTLTVGANSPLVLPVFQSSGTGSITGIDFYNNSPATGSFYLAPLAAVPEPSTLALAALGGLTGLGLAIRRRLKK